MITLKTDRLTLREFLPTDAQALYDLHADAHVMRYTGDLSFPSLEATQAFIADYPKRQYLPFKTGRLAVLEKKSGDFIGWCGLKTQDDGSIDLDYRFFTQYWGQGYATEASAACIAYGFDVLGLTAIHADAVEANIASIKAKEKSGMERIGPHAIDGQPGIAFRITAIAYRNRLQIESAS